MAEVLRVFPGAQRALFRKYHIGGCSSCGFDPNETLGQVCARNNNLDVREVLAHIEQSHEADQQIYVTPQELKRWLSENVALRLVTTCAQPRCVRPRSRAISGETSTKSSGCSSER